MRVRVNTSPGRAIQVPSQGPLTTAATICTINGRSHRTWPGSRSPPHFPMLAALVRCGLQYVEYGDSPLDRRFVEELRGRRRERDGECDLQRMQLGRIQPRQLDHDRIAVGRRRQRPGSRELHRLEQFRGGCPDRHDGDRRARLHRNPIGRGCHERRTRRRRRGGPNSNYCQRCGTFGKCDGRRPPGTVIYNFDVVEGGRARQRHIHRCGQSGYFRDVLHRGDIHAQTDRHGRPAYRLRRCTDHRERRRGGGRPDRSSGHRPHQRRPDKRRHGGLGSLGVGGRDQRRPQERRHASDQQLLQARDGQYTPVHGQWLPNNHLRLE